MENLEYHIRKTSAPIEIDANWNKEVWQNTESLLLNNKMGSILKYRPIVEVKLRYDSSAIYVIFKVDDQYVRCLSTEPNSPVWTDSCVEFFFAPNTLSPEKYFNLEINCGGTPLMFFNLIPRKDYEIVDERLLKQIKIAHTLPKTIEEEIAEPTQWILEYCLPFELLTHYTEIDPPKEGVIWKANFYKIADNTSNPHYLTWNPVIKAEPDFHLPDFFGTLRFE